MKPEGGADTSRCKVDHSPGLDGFIRVNEGIG